MAYGCYNRPPFPAGRWVHTRDPLDGTPKVEYIPHVMTKTCQYQLNDKYNDQGCIGCSHKDSPDGKLI